MKTCLYVLLTDMSELINLINFSYAFFVCLFILYSHFERKIFLRHIDKYLL